MGLLSMVVVSLPLTVFAGDPAKGKELVLEKGCSACHSETGNSVTPTFPILAGQYESYLIQALTQYRGGHRKIPVMAGIAASLTEQDIQDIAAWFSSNESRLDYIK